MKGGLRFGNRAVASGRKYFSVLSRHRRSFDRISLRLPTISFLSQWRIKDLLGASPCLKSCRTDLWAALSGGLLVQLREGELPRSNLQAGGIKALLSQHSDSRS